ARAVFPAVDLLGRRARPERRVHSRGRPSRPRGRDLLPAGVPVPGRDRARPGAAVPFLDRDLEPARAEQEPYAGAGDRERGPARPAPLRLRPHAALVTVSDPDDRIATALACHLIGEPPRAEEIERWRSAIAAQRAELVTARDRALWARITRAPW